MKIRKHTYRMRYNEEKGYRLEIDVNSLGEWRGRTDWMPGISELATIAPTCLSLSDLYELYRTSCIF